MQRYEEAIERAEKARRQMLDEAERIMHEAINPPRWYRWTEWMVLLGIWAMCAGFVVYAIADPERWWAWFAIAGLLWASAGYWSVMRRRTRSMD